MYCIYCFIYRYKAYNILNFTYDENINLNFSKLLD